MNNVDVIIKRTIVTVEAPRRETVEVGSVRSDVDSVAGKTGNVVLEIGDIQNLQETIDNIEASSDANYVHTQDAASNFWTVNHNLHKFPSVTIIDSGNNQVFGDVDYLDDNSFTIAFSVAFSGRAIAN